MKVALITGKFYGKPTSFTTSNGNDGYGFSVGSYDPYKKQNDFFSCVAFGKLAEVIRRGFQIGDAVAICANITNDEYTNKKGENVKVTKFQVIQVDMIGMLARSRADGYKSAPEEPPVGAPPQENEDMPF